MCSSDLRDRPVRRGQTPNSVSDEKAGQADRYAVKDAVIPHNLHDEPIEKPRAVTRIRDAEQNLRRPHAQVLALHAREAATEIGDEIRSAGAHGICRCAEDERVRDDKLAHARRVPVPDRGTEASDDGRSRGGRFAVNRFARAPMFHRACP